MSAPPIGTISRKPSASDTRTSSQKAAAASVDTNSSDQQDQQDAERALTGC